TDPLLLLGTRCSICRALSSGPKNFPPGPTPLPIFGTIFSLNLQNPLKDLERLRKCYGNVYSLFIGSTPAVVINGFHATKEALVTKAADFSGRPHYTLISDFTKRWRARRRFSLLTLRNFGMGKQFMEDRILGETHYIVEQLEKSAGMLTMRSLIPLFIE
uniref:Cytochrome P450 2F2-like n=1 Tax=Myripristis murdjan TaxID=586833 RepID=A0A667WJS2_9TELE